MSEWIDNYLDDYPDIFSKELFEQISAQNGEFSKNADAARDLIKIKQDREETFAELANRITKFASLAYFISKAKVRKSKNSK